MTRLHRFLLPGLLAILAPAVANAQAFRVQCPLSTKLHPATFDTTGNITAVDPGIKCQQVSGGDGMSSMADGTQIYMFSFGPLSGLDAIAHGQPGTQTASVFMQPFDPTNNPNGAVGLSPDADAFNQVDPNSGVANPTNACAPYVAPNPAAGIVGNAGGYGGPNGPVPQKCYTGHVDPRQVMDVGILNGNIPAPMMAIDEDDEFFLTLTNVGMILRPDLFEQHTIHFHGYPNASSFYDGVPDASVAINIGASMSYYYLAPDAGTYFWHCHITPPEHLQMGMVGQLYVRPRQNRAQLGASLLANWNSQQIDLRTASNCATDILCSAPRPLINTATQTNNHFGAPYKYAYNDGDGSTRYDVEYPIQMHGFDPSFHWVATTFNPEEFIDMKDKYFLLNGRSYPDTVNETGYVDPNAGSGTSSLQGQPMGTPAMYTQDADGVARPSQPLPTVIHIPAGGRALLRISDLNVTEYHTLATLGIPMQVVGYNARLLRDEAGNNLYYTTNSISLAGGESCDVILDATGYTAGQIFYLYTPQLDHLSNDAENFGGMLTEIHID